MIDRLIQREVHRVFVEGDREREEGRKREREKESCKYVLVCIEEVAQFHQHIKSSFYGRRS